MNALNTDCHELEDFGIDPIALLDWAHRKQARLVFDTALPRTSAADRTALFNGAARLHRNDSNFFLKQVEVAETIVPDDPTYIAPLIR